jgi:pilus assembly protein CpaC
MGGRYGAPRPVGRGPGDPCRRPEQAVARRLDLSIGRSVIIDLPRDAKEGLRRQPQGGERGGALDPKSVVIGVDNGATSIFVMDAEGRQIAALEVSVGRDLNVLRQTLRTVLSHAAIEISRRATRCFSPAW